MVKNQKLTRSKARLCAALLHRDGLGNLREIAVKTMH